MSRAGVGVLWFQKKRMMVVYAADHVQVYFSDVPGGSLGTQEAAGAESGFQPFCTRQSFFYGGECVCVCGHLSIPAIVGVTWWVEQRVHSLSAQPVL